jgi:predicted regulator of Ras-like GTPase activity (Roadblock/LC7/MglB family)
MSNSARSKFAGLFRGLFRRNGHGEAADAALPPEPLAAEPAAISATASAPAASAPPPEISASADELALPLAPIIATLPLELRAKIMSVPSPGRVIHLPLEVITAQLAFGAVKISFGELRRLAPGIFTNAGGEHDNKSISLPLNEILARINPALLARRSRKTVEVAEDINGPFNERGKGIVFTAQPLKTPAPAAPATPPRPTTPPPAPKTAAPPAAFSLPPRQIQPAVSTPPPPLAQPIPFAAPTGFDRPRPAALNGNGNGNGHHTPPPPPPAALKISAAPIAPRPEPAQPTISVALHNLMENWPDELKDEITRLGFAKLNVPLSGAVVEAGLKRGRVTMTWKQLRTLTQPGSPASLHDDTELELPLKVIAPLFFGTQKNSARTQKKSVVSDEIPNLFFGFPQPAPAPVAPPPTRLAPNPALPASAAAPNIAPGLTPKPVGKKTSDSNFYTLSENSKAAALDDSVYAPPAVPQTDFTSRHAPPKEVVARAMALAGVVGVVITLPDGLRVASEVPPDFNADTLAAFIPQLFERMNQSARELRMGALNNVSFTVGNVPWRIFRVNAVYLAAFGRAGEPLPTAQLAALAGELDRKKQQ